MAARVTAKKTPTAKRPARPRTAPAVPTAEEDPQVLRLVTDPDEEPEERVPIFYIDDVEYTVPIVMRTNDALDCLHAFRTQGQIVAVDFLLERVLGVDGYRALRAYKGLKTEHLQTIVKTATDLMMGATEAPKA